MKLRKASKTFGAVALIVAFGLFNVGVPVSLYFCPMTNSNLSECPMTCSSTPNELSVLNQSPACCGKVVLAERNTTPFVKAQPIDKEKDITITTLNQVPIPDAAVAQRTNSVESIQLHSPPVFLLNSSLLI